MRINGSEYFVSFPNQKGLGKNDVKLTLEGKRKLAEKI